MSASCLQSLRTTNLQALRSSVFAGCSPCVVFMRRIYIVRHICTPCSSYLQALCIICAGLMQYICRPCAAYLQAAPYSQALLCIRVVGPVAYLQAQALCIILAGPVPVQHMHTLCSIFAAHCASYLHLPCRPCGISIILAGCFTSCSIGARVLVGFTDT